jgi:hypothetical protein
MSFGDFFSSVLILTKMDWATFWAIFYKLIRSPCSETNDKASWNSLLGVSTLTGRNVAKVFGKKNDYE